MGSSSKKPDYDLSPWAEPSWTHGTPSPYYNSSHHAIRDYIRTYIDQNVLPNALEWEAAGGAPHEEQLAWARTGVPFADVPAAYRPAGAPIGPAGIPVSQLDPFHLLIMTDENARVEGGVMANLAGSSVIGLPPVLVHGTEEQKREWLPGLWEWKTSFCLGVTEPQAGSDVGGIQTEAIRKGNEYVVNGYKKWITGTPWATHMTAAVRTGSTDSGRHGISVLVIPMKSQGLSWRRIENSGQKAGGASLVEFDNVHVPVKNLIGHENEGFKILMTNFNKERFIMSVACNRHARTCLSTSFRYALNRKTFGKPLISNQIIANKMTTLARYIESHWSFLESIAYTVTQSPKGWQDPDVAGRAALAKAHGGRILELANREAQQVLGGAGYQRGGPGASIEQMSRDLRMMVVGGGSEEIISDLAVRQEISLAKRRGWKL